MKIEPRYYIKKAITFEASHILQGLPEGHKCTRLHGHSWRAEVTLSAVNLDETGMVLDFGVVGALKDKLDHRHLNEVLQFNPTSENVARWIYETMTALLLQADAHEDVTVEIVKVCETCTSECELRREAKRDEATL